MKNVLYGILAVIIVVIVAVVVNLIPRGYKEKEVPRSDSGYRVMTNNLRNAYSD